MIRNLFGGTTKCRTIDKCDIFGDGSGVALYRLDGNANDESGNYHGTETNVTYGGGVYDRGMVGTSSNKITIPYSFPEISGTNNFSISVWIKRGDTSTSEQNILSQLQTLGGAYSHCIEIYNNLVRFAVNSSTTFTVSAPMDTTNWHHIVVIRNGTNLSMCLDNVATNFTSFPTINYYNIEWRISSGASTICGFNGSIDQLRIFNRAITATEVATLYAECEPTSIVDNINPFEDGSLKALYKFDDDATDATGVYNGTATNVTYASGKFGNCAVFGGSTVNAKITSPYQFPSGGNAISIWAKVGSANQSGACLFGYLAGTRQSFLRNDYNFLTAGAWMHRLPSGEKVCTNLDEWYHIVYTSNGSEPLKLYVNGVLRTNLIVTNFNWTTFAIDGLGFYLTSSTENLTGKLDQLRIFNKALTPLEVASLYNETTPLEEPMSVQVDPFKDGSGKALYRLEGNSLDESGNYNGTPTSVTYGAGRFGRCGVFNGSSSFISTLPYTQMNYANGFTFSCWINTSITNGGLDTIAFQGSDGNVSEGFWIGNYNNTLFAQVYQKNATMQYSSSGFANGQWRHVVLSISSSGYVVYLDGVAIITINSTASVTTGSTNPTPLNVGRCYGVNNGNNYFQGSIDQVRIFNRALTQSEVTELYNEI